MRKLFFKITPLLFVCLLLAQIFAPHVCDHSDSDKVTSENCVQCLFAIDGDEFESYEPPFTFLQKPLYLLPQKVPISTVHGDILFFDEGIILLRSPPFLET